MKKWTDWETISHHVTICGRILDTSGRPMPGIHLNIVPQGNQSESQLARTPSSRSRGRMITAQQALETSGVRTWKETTSRSDGTFFFLDCPEGEYTLKAVDPQSGIQTQQIIFSKESAARKAVKDRKPNEGYRIELVLK